MGREMPKNVQRIGTEILLHTCDSRNEWSMSTWLIIKKLKMFNMKASDLSGNYEKNIYIPRKKLKQNACQWKKVFSKITAIQLTPSVKKNKWTLLFLACSLDCRCRPLQVTWGPFGGPGTHVVWKEPGSALSSSSSHWKTQILCPEVH